MAKSKYEYVREYEQVDAMLKDCWIVIRLDGSNFHRFSDKHQFTKPNDRRALDLANRAALGVMQIFPDCVFAYGQSDEFSFILRPDTKVHSRRRSKLVSLAVSKYTSVYQFYWSEFFPNTKLLYPPTFDGRCILYPTKEIVRDYISWRQVDCHINNLYNTTFHKLIQIEKLSPTEAEKKLSKTLSADKHEILHQMGLNYNNEEEIFKKGSILIAADEESPENLMTWETENSEEKKHLMKRPISLLHCDVIGDKFWNERPSILLSLKELKRKKKEDFKANDVKRLKITNDK